MKKNFAFGLLAIASIGSIALSSCTNNRTNSSSYTDRVIRAYNNINTNARLIYQSTEIKNGTFIIATEEISYDIASNKKVTVTKTANDLSASEAWTTTTETETVNVTRITHNYQESLFSSISFNDDNTIMFASIANENIKTVYGIENSSINGYVNLRFVMSVDESENIEIDTIYQSYISSTNNVVEIVTSYHY